MNIQLKKNKGFSLIELSIVLVIVGILAGSFISTIGSRIENTRRSDTIAQLNTIRDAIIGFASSKGRLPCPADTDTLGVESPDGGGACLQHGFIPGKTLGLRGSYNRDELLLDNWGNPIRYSVTLTSASLNGIPDFTTTGEMQAEGIDTLVPDLNICDEDSTAADVCAGSNSLINNAPFIIMSLGKDGDSFVAAIKPNTAQGENSGEVLATKNAAGEDIAYLLPGNRAFVSKVYSSEGSAAGYYDDILIWESPFVLYAKMIEAGRLP